VKVGDLVRLPPAEVYWWAGKVGIIDLVESRGNYPKEYRVFISPNRYARFNDPEFVELISESR